MTTDHTTTKRKRRSGHADRTAAPSLVPPATTSAPAAPGPTPTLGQLAAACEARMRELLPPDQAAASPRAQARSHVLSAARQMRIAGITFACLGAITREQALTLDEIVAGARAYAKRIEERPR